MNKQEALDKIEELKKFVESCDRTFEHLQFDGRWKVTSKSHNFFSDMEDKKKMWSEDEFYNYYVVTDSTDEALILVREKK